MLIAIAMGSPRLAWHEVINILITDRRSSYLRLLMRRLEMTMFYSSFANNPILLVCLNMLVKYHPPKTR